MKQEKDYIQDIAAIRSMMERSSKFLSLSGWSGILAGIYALIGAGIVRFGIQLSANEYSYTDNEVRYTIITALGVLLMAIVTAILFSFRKAMKNNQSVWNPVSKKMLVSMGVPLVTGGVLMLMILKLGYVGLLPCFSMIFYGLALFNAGNYTFNEIKILGVIQVVLGLLGFYFPDYSLTLWALGFGVMHIVYGAYIHYKYER